MQAIEDKLKVAEGNINQGQIGVSYAADKLKEAKAQLIELKDHVMTEAGAAQRITNNFQNYSYESESDKSLSNAKVSANKDLDLLKAKAGSLIGMYSHIQDMESKIQLLSDGEKDKLPGEGDSWVTSEASSSFVSELQSSIKKLG